MSNTIIECRNKDSENAISNGDWTTTLGQSLTINDGDQILVKDIFIDTQATSSQKIIIPYGITASIEFGYYKNQLTTDGLSQIANFPAVSQKDQELVLCIQKNSTDPNEILIQKLGFNKFNNRKNNEKVDITISYTDFDNQTQSLIVHIPENLESEFIIPEIQGKVAIGDLTYNPPISVLNEKYNIKISSFQSLATNGKRICIPYTETAYIDIPKGNYDPDALCTLINNYITSLGNSGGSFVVDNSPILKDAQALQNKYRGGSPQANTYEFAFAFAGSELYSIDPMINYNPLNPSILMGSNQFELDFNQNTSSFQFNYLHFPYLYQKNLAVQILKITQGTFDVFTTQTRYGGVYIKSFGAIDATNSPFNFWEGLLGFKKTIYPDFNFTEKNTTGPNVDYLIPNFPISELSSTSGLITMDAFVDKTNPITTNKTFPSNSSLATDQTRNLVAGNSALDIQNSFGYYVIEVGSKFKNNFYTPDNNHKNIQSIVSRYYELNSYTTGTSEGSLIYTHKGEPLLLESFRCRILNSDKVLASNIGNDNTIHIAIIRNSPEYPLPPPPPDADDKKEQKKK